MFSLRLGKQVGAWLSCRPVLRRGDYEAGVIHFWRMYFPKNASISLLKLQRDGSHTTAWVCDNSHIKKGPFRSSQGCFHLPLGKHAPQPHFVALASGQPTHMRDKERGLWTTKKVKFFFIFPGEEDWALIFFT